MIDIAVKPGYLYLLRNTVLGGYKIGITTAPESRFKALSVGDKTELVGYWQTDYYRELEKHYHKLYKDERVPQSEWFDLTDTAVDDIVNQMHSSAVTQWLDPEKRAAFVGSQFNYVPPYRDSGMSGWNYMGLVVIAMTIAYFLGATIQ